MNTDTDLVLPASMGAAAGVRAVDVLKSRFDLRTLFLLLGAVLATAVSLAIAVFAGWQRGGVPMERAMNVSLCCVAVLYVHFLLVVWRIVGVLARIFAFAVWWLAFAVVLYGQVSFFMLSQQHAGEGRAAAVTPAQASPGAVMPAGRTWMQITWDIARITTALAQANVRRCSGDCAALAARRQTLAARLVVFNAEEDEALRREADQDRVRKRADRVEALREMSRVDPIALAVASRLHTTENLFALVVALACAVVLEGAAILGWLLLSVAAGRVASRDAVVSDGRAVVTGREDAATPCAAVDEQESTVVAAPLEESRTTDAVGAATAPDERRLETIRSAVLAGTLDPTQESIRKLLRCGQPTAGRLNRLYGKRYGSQAAQGEAPLPLAASDATPA